MKILISNTSDSPLYQQIKDQIKEAILQEELVKGDSLPSIRAFANDLKVSVLTIRRVYNELEEEGFIVSQVGIHEQYRIAEGFEASSCGRKNAGYAADCKVFTYQQRRIECHDGHFV